MEKVVILSGVRTPIGAFSILVGLAHNDLFDLGGFNTGPPDGLIEDQGP